MMWTTQPRSELAPGLMGFEIGTGPRLLLLHGVGLRAEAWGAVWPHLAHRFRLIMVDLPGHGASARLVGEPGMADYVRALEPLARDVTAIIGHSFGAMLALELAAQVPLRGVVAMNAIYRRSAEAAAAVRARAAALDGMTAPNPMATLARWFGHAPTGILADCAAACGEWLRQGNPAGYRAAYHVFAHADGPEDGLLAGLGCPALFLTATDDGNSTPAMSTAMAAACPRGRALTLPGAHMLPMTDGPGVAAAIATFLEEC